jgi:hypothetical protein
MKGPMMTFAAQPSRFRHNECGCAVLALRGSCLMEIIPGAVCPRHESGFAVDDGGARQ